MGSNDINILNIESGLLWLIPLMFYVVILVGYLANWSFQNLNMRGISISFIFGFLLIMAFFVAILSIFTFKLPSQFGGDFLENQWRIPSIGFVLGFLFMVLISKFNDVTKYSILAIQKNSLLSTVTSQLPRFWEFTVTVIFAPVIEEVFFIYAIPQIVIWFFNILGKKFEILDNIVMKLGSAIIISSVLFAWFHVGTSATGIFWAAIFFRALTIIFLWGDLMTNWVWFATVPLSFTIGMHMGNNWMFYGFWTGLGILASSFIGYFLLLYFALNIVGVIDKILLLVGWRTE